MAATRTVTGHYETPDGAPAVGVIRFIPSATLYDAAEDTVVTPAPLNVALNGSGSFTVVLLCTDDPAVNPQGWTWIVTEHVVGGREFAFHLPTSAPAAVDITELAPAVDVDLTWAYASYADLADYADRLDDIEANAAVVTASAVIHPFLVMGS